MTGGIQAASGYAVAIGINQYEHFQPLHYAVRDAQAVQTFLKESQLPIDRAGQSERTRVVLLADSSPMVQQGNTYPNRANVEAAIDYIIRQAQASDYLWIFFSGYGVEVNGQDYLMPIEGDSVRVEETGIAIAQLFFKLQAAATRNILVLLDINRSQSATTNARIGEQTAAIAAQTGIATILSCQPDQFSHETLALRHGLFTSAVLEGLRYGNCTTIDHLVQFLDSRLVELSEHHWRPRQDAMAIVPAPQRYQLLWPRSQPMLDATSTNGKQSVPLSATLENGHADSAGTPEPTVPIAIATGLPDRPTVPTSTLPPGIVSTAVVPVLPPAATNGANQDDSHFQRSLLMLGGLLFALLCLGVLFQNRTEFTEAPTPTTNVNPTAAPTTTAVSPTDTPTSPTSTSPPAPTRAATPQPQPTRPVASPTPTVTTPAVTVAPAATSSSDLNAIRAALDRSLAASPTTQISAFNQAIQQARRIPNTDPAYAQAQQDIDRWSALILRVAEQRANQSNGGSRQRAVQNYRSAIDAAKLVPRDRPTLYARAQQLIAAWNRRIQ
ncbi:caspase family protein [Microcoleus sp. FACHB-1515]|uniref:caspase family protein n=1 Tax=Cyanophyceae TaxID=3028117 RepID=UPI001684AEB1|nr:caspase family protein [Microcoleus sp. FACHB-1515]MBD2089081.1 caspase family protein [Microcoleus sp. FACHB-1515]